MFQQVEGSKFKISEKLMRKDVSRGGDVQVQEIRKMMRKDVSGGGFQKFRKNDEKRRFRRLISKIPKKR